MMCSGFSRQLRRLNESFPLLLRMRGLKQEAFGWVSAADSSSAIVEGSRVLSGLIKNRNSLLQRLAPWLQALPKPELIGLLINRALYASARLLVMAKSLEPLSTKIIDVDVGIVRNSDSSTVELLKQTLITLVRFTGGLVRVKSRC